MILFSNLLFELNFNLRTESRRIERRLQLEDSPLEYEEVPVERHLNGLPVNEFETFVHKRSFNPEFRPFSRRGRGRSRRGRRRRGESRRRGGIGFYGSKVLQKAKVKQKKKVSLKKEESTTPESQTYNYAEENYTYEPIDDLNKKYGLSYNTGQQLTTNNDSGERTGQKKLVKKKVKKIKGGAPEGAKKKVIKRKVVKKP